MRSSHFNRAAVSLIQHSLFLVPSSLFMTACLDTIPPDTITHPDPGSVVGQVTDFCSNQPVASAGVIATEVLAQGTGAVKHSTTSSAGNYRVDQLTPGTWKITVSKKDFQTTEKSVVVAADKGSRLDLTLAPTPKTVPTAVKLDVLFVVDNSNSMEHEQKALASAFPAFINTLLGYKFMLDLRVGVISTDMGAGQYQLPSCEMTGGDAGKLQSKPRTAGCVPPYDPYISVNGTKTNVAGDMVNEAFACIVKLGLQGCGFEQHLAAISKAIDGKSNPGFPRQDSVLAVVVVSDEDDCSAANTQLFDPSQQGLTDPLGPLTSFRCFEFGVTCQCTKAGKCDRTTAGPRVNCRPTGKYLQDVDQFITKLKASRGKDRVFFAVIGGSADRVEVGFSGSNPMLKPSCQTAMGFAVPAVRLSYIVDQLKPASSFDTICQANLQTPMTNIAKKIAETALFNPCVK